MMIQEIVNPPTDTETLPETPLEKEPCVPIAEVVKEMTAAGSNTIGNRLNEAVTWWRKLPRERQILFEFVGLSVDERHGASPGSLHAVHPLEGTMKSNASLGLARGGLPS